MLGKQQFGLQDVDGLKPSEYLIETAKEHIEGKITISEADKRIQSYYEERQDRSPSKSMEKFMDAKSKEAGFKEYSTFHFSVGIVRIDGVDGRVAYVAKLNPKEFQVVNAKELTDIKSDYNKDPLGGTRFVYFSFRYTGIMERILKFLHLQQKVLTA